MTVLTSNHKDPQLSQIAEWLLLNGTLNSCAGLLHGKMGIALFFFHYAHFTNQSLFEEYAWNLLMGIQEQIHANYRPDYESGIAGIGVGMDYLIRKEFLAVDPDFFEDLDKRMYRAVMYDPCPNYSRDEGLIGYGWYWLCRQENKKASECLEKILWHLEQPDRVLTKEESRDVLGFRCAYDGKSLALREMPKLRANHMGLSGGYAGAGLSRLTEIGAISADWKTLL